MRILIKGMEMPKSCNDCNFQCFAEWGGDSSYANEITTKCLATDKFVFPSDSERDENCPLIELPPQGRLIDADALRIDLIDRGIADIQTSDWYEIRQAVCDAPTIIEAEV